VRARRISPLHLPYISPLPLYLPCISPVSRLYLPSISQECEQGALAPRGALEVLGVGVRVRVRVSPNPNSTPLTLTLTLTLTLNQVLGAAGTHEALARVAEALRPYLRPYPYPFPCLVP